MYVNELAKTTGIKQGTRHELAYRDWQTGVPMEGITLGGVTIVRPDHPDPPADAILLDPSVVFGDGDHPTTKACLDYFSAINQVEHIDTVLDLGTGTGVLGLVAARCGARKVVAVDRNMLAVQTAKDNVERNGLGKVMNVFLGEARHYVHEEYDLVFANLPFSVLRDIFTARELVRQRRWIVSGIDENQARVLQDILLEIGYAISRKRIDRPWVTFVAVSSGRRHLSGED